MRPVVYFPKLEAANTAIPAYLAAGVDATAWRDAEQDATKVRLRRDERASRRTDYRFCRPEFAIEA